MPTHPLSMPSPVSADQDAWLRGRTSILEDINRALDDQAAKGMASEDFLQGVLERLLSSGLDQSPDYWPTLARLAELTLYSAGWLALAGEFAACGDLLLNPGGKLLHIKGSPTPLAIRRHQPLTSQVAHLVPEGWETIQWLKYHTILEIPQQALLPRLRQELKSCPGAEEYLEFFDQDQGRLTSGLVLLASLDQRQPANPAEIVAGFSAHERKWIDQRLYWPDLSRYQELRLLMDGAMRPAASTRQADGPGMAACSRVAERR